MHRKQEVDLLPLDTEIERTLKNMRKITVAESRSMANKEKDCRLFQKKKKKQRELRGLILWRTFGGLLFKRSAL